MFPGIALYLSSMYTRKELSLRLVIFVDALDHALHQLRFLCRLTNLFSASSRIALFFSAASVRGSESRRPWSLRSFRLTELFILAFWSVLWSSCGRNSENEWGRWQAWLGLDFHSGMSLPSQILSIQSTMQQEGLFTVIIGIIGFFVIPSSPRESKYLTEEEKE